MSARARIVPRWSGTVDAAGVLRLDATGLFREHLKRSLSNTPVIVTVRKIGRPKSKSQLGFLFGVLYPVIAEEFCDTDYDVAAIHDAFMRTLRGLKPEPNPLQLRETLRDKDHAYVSDYISDLRHHVLTEYGLVTPDPTKVETPRTRIPEAA